MARHATLTHFLDAARDTLFRRASAGEPPAAAAARVFEALERPASTSSRGGNTPPPAYRHLVPALEQAKSAPETAALAATLAALEPSLRWIRRAGSETHGEAFHDGHANAVIVGPDGLERRGDVLIGVSIVAPNVRYVDHRHPPEEVYIVMSDGEWYQEGRGWHTPGVGGIVYNSPNVVHAMRAGAESLLAVWLLPTD